MHLDQTAEEERIIKHNWRRKCVFTTMWDCGRFSSGLDSLNSDRNIFTHIAYYPSLSTSRSGNAKSSYRGVLDLYYSPALINPDLECALLVYLTPYAHGSEINSFAYVF